MADAAGIERFIQAILSNDAEPDTSSETSFSESDDEHETSSTIADDTTFPESDVSFHDNGASISELGNAAFEKLAARQAAEPKEDTDAEWARKWLVFACKVFGDPGLRSLKRTMDLLRSGRSKSPQQQQKVPAAIQEFLDNICAVHRHLAELENEQYVKCKAAADVARSWQPFKARLDANDAELLEFIERSQDIQRLKQHKPDGANEDLCKGWLALKLYSTANEEGSLDGDKLDEAWQNINRKIAIGEHLLLFEHHFGSAVFLLFIKGWESLFQEGHLEMTRGMIEDFLLRNCPRLPTLVKNLDPIALHVDNDGGALPRYGFEALDAFKDGNQSLESLLSVTEGGAT